MMHMTKDISNINNTADESRVTGKSKFTKSQAIAWLGLVWLLRYKKDKGEELKFDAKELAQVLRKSVPRARALIHEFHNLGIVEPVSRYSGEGFGPVLPESRVYEWKYKYGVDDNDILEFLKQHKEILEYLGDGNEEEGLKYIKKILNMK